MYTRDTVGNTFLQKNFTFDSKTLDLKIEGCHWCRLTIDDLLLTEISALIVLNSCSRIISLLLTSLASQVIILRIILISFFSQPGYVTAKLYIHSRLLCSSSELFPANSVAIIGSFP